MTKLLRYYETGASVDFAEFHAEQAEWLWKNAMTLIPFTIPGRRQLAEDLVQETFTKVFRTRGKSSAFSIERGAPVEAWLSAILKNALLDQIAPAPVAPQGGEADYLAGIPDESSPDPQAACVQSEVVEKLRAAISNLPGDKQDLVNRVLLNGEKQATVGADLRLSTVATCRTLKSIKKELAQQLVMLQ